MAYPTLWETGDGRWTNSIRMIDRLGGLAGEYCKNHPVLAEMAEGVVCGTEAPIIECDFGRTACVICFDLNFDELRHTYAAARPDLILFSSMYHGGLMQQYWAYSCRSHFVSAIGNTFPSSIVSPVGHVLASSTNYCSFVSAEVNLDCALVHLDGHRGKLQAIRETYGTKAKVFDPGYLGSVLLSSETDDFTVNELIREFELEPLDRYFARSLAARRGTATQC
ncbi:MAG: carbon-nitrogen hydrolase family protein [Paenibacillus sp.]|nr:carbon-nitrogen hydrolase family protein [Paenibacillus sp.]